MIYEVKVKPGSKKGPCVIAEQNQLIVFLCEKPVDGEANAAPLRILAKHFDVPKSSIRIKTGTRGRSKLIEIS